MRPIILVIKLLSYFKLKFIRRLSFVFFFSIFTTIVETLFVISTVPLLNYILSPEKNIASINLFNIFTQTKFNIEINILSASLSFIIFIIFTSLVRICNIYLLNTTSAKVGAELCKEVFLKVLNKPYIFFSKNDSSSYMSMITKFANRSSNSIQGLMILTRSFLLILGLIIALAYVDKVIAINSLFLLAFTALIIISITRKTINTNSIKGTDALAKSYKVLQESFGGIREIILSNSQKFYTNEFTKEDSQVKIIDSINQYYASFPRYLLEAIGLSILIIITIIGRINGTDSTYLISKIGALGIGVQRLLPAFYEFYSSITNIRAESSDVSKIIRFLKEDDQYRLDKFKEYKDEKHYKDKLTFKNIINLENISFSYNEKVTILDGITISIKKGEKIGIIGSTGSGKSTLVDIIMGLLEPQNGCVKVDNICVNKNNINPKITKQWQTKISHVPQDIYLSNTSILENISNFSLNNPSEKEKAVKYSKLASIHNFISSLDKGYNEIVGERGVKLSGGQKQRIGIARAFYKESPLLILDEATSALDELTEGKIMNDLYQYFPELTVIIIAHRKNTLLHCDRIIEIDNKKIKRIFKPNLL